MLKVVDFQYICMVFLHVESIFIYSLDRLTNQSKTPFLFSKKHNMFYYVFLTIKYIQYLPIFYFGFSSSIGVLTYICVHSYNIK